MRFGVVGVCCVPKHKMHECVLIWQGRPLDQAGSMQMAWHQALMASMQCALDPGSRGTGLSNPVVSLLTLMARSLCAFPPS